MFISSLGRWLAGVAACFMGALQTPCAHAQGVGRPDLRWISGGHSGGQLSIALSPDGQIFATSGYSDGTVKLWRVSDGGLIRTMGGGITQMKQVLFTPDGQYLVSVSDYLPGGEEGEYKLWRVADGVQVRSFGGNGASGTISAGPVAISPDGSTLATGYNYDKTRLWRIADGALLRTVEGAGHALGYSPDGSILVVHTYGEVAGPIQVWRTSDWTLLRSFDASGENGLDFWAAAVSPDGRTLATAYNNTLHTVRLWDLATGQVTRVLDTVEHFGAYTVAFSPDGAQLTVAGSEDVFGGGYLHRLFLFDTASGSLVRTIPAHYSATFAVAYAPDGIGLASGGADDLIHLWDSRSGDHIRKFGIRRGAVLSVAFSPDSSLLAAGDGGNETLDGADVELFRVRDGLRLRTCHGHRDVINGVAFAPDGLVLASGAGSPPPDTIEATVRLWRVSDGANLWIAPGHDDGTTSVTFALDGQVVVSGGRDHFVKVWARANGALLRTIAGHSHAVEAVALSPDGTLLASAGDQTVRVWRTSDWSHVRTIFNEGWNVNAVAFSPNGAALAITTDQYGENLRLVRVADGSLIRVFDGDPFDFMRHPVFTSDGRHILCSSQGYPPRIWIWDSSAGTLATFYEQEIGWRYRPCLAISPNGGSLAIGRTDATVEVARARFWTPRPLAPVPP